MLTAFASKARLQAHEKLHTNQHSFHCDICNHGFHGRTALADHQWIHTGIKRHACKLCGDSFTTAAKLRNHRVTQHENQQLVCSECVTGVVHDAAVQQQTENEEVRFHCKVCGQHFQSMRALKSHLQKHRDANVKAFDCSVCQKHIEHAVSL